MLVCPHATIRAKIFDRQPLAGKPETFKAVEARWKDYKQDVYKRQEGGGAKGADDNWVWANDSALLRCPPASLTKEIAV